MTARVSSSLRRRLGRSALLTVLLAPSLAACGAGDASAPSSAQAEADASTCDADPRAEAYVAGMTQQSQEGRFALQLLQSDPAPPAKGDNTWDIRLLDATGASLDGATIDVQPFMPDHGHGTSLDAVVVPASSGKGEYSISPVNLWMPGLWQVTLHVEAAELSDDVVLGFCIAG